MNPAITFATAIYAGAVVASLVIGLIFLRKIGWLSTARFENAIGRTVKIGLIFWLVAVGLSLRQDVLHAQALAKQANCKGHMKPWAMSLHLHNEEFGNFPPSTMTVDENRHSWRVRVAHYAVAPEFLDQYDTHHAWDSADNIALENAVERYFHCPDHTLSDDMTKTSYVAVIGPNCVLRDENYPPRRFEDLNPDAVLLVETTRADIHWMAPEDLSYDRLVADREYAESILGGPHPNGGHYVTVDGRVATIASIGIDELLRRCVVTNASTAD